MLFEKHTIFEGPDGVGKTTLINILTQLSNFKTINYTNKDINTYNFWKEEYSKIFKSKDKFIMSRSFLSELIYTDIFSRKPRITLEQEEQLVEYIKDKIDLVIILPKSREELKQRLVKRGDYPNVIENINKIITAYEEVAKKYNLKTIVV